jgi:hypothetical protein
LPSYYYESGMQCPASHPQNQCQENGELKHMPPGERKDKQRRRSLDESAKPSSGRCSERDIPRKVAKREPQSSRLCCSLPYPTSCIPRHLPGRVHTLPD